MTASRKDVARRIIPRWHDLHTALAEGELGSLHRPAIDLAERGHAELNRMARNWLDRRTLSAAAELIAASAVIGTDPATFEAARSVTASEDAPRLTRVSAQRLLETEATALEVSTPESAAETLDPEIRKEAAVARIATLKRTVRRDPRQALAWSEIARQYEILGQRRQANQAMKMALRTAPDNRFVLRSAARLAIHHDDPERAHRLVEQSPRTPHDPWLVSAEIALASRLDRRSQLIKHGERMIASDQFHLADVSELATALGTEELNSSRTRQARRLFEHALREPTENAIAQVEWASQYIGGLTLEPEHLERPDSYEARALQHAERGEWQESLNNSWLWLAALPFASAPGIHGSHQASVGGNFAQGAAIAQAGLVANPDEFLLNNNLAYCLLELDKVKDAEPYLVAMRGLKRSDEEEMVFLATSGLHQFRKGSFEEGRRLYLDALGRAKNPDDQAVVLIELAREEIICGSSEAPQAVERALNAAARAGGSLFQRSFISLLLEQLQATKPRA